MEMNIDRYLSTLLSYTPSQAKGSRYGEDYVSLIHVPASGAESVYTLSIGEAKSLMTTARYRESIWDSLEGGEAVEALDSRAEVDVLQAEIDTSHPIFEIISAPLLLDCEDRSDGCPGMDYYLLLWQKDGYAAVSECWEPYMRNDQAWTTMISALHVLASQYEHAALAW